MSDETRYVPGPNGGLVGIMPDYQNADRAAGVLGGQYLGLKPGNPPTLLSELQQRRLSKAKFLEGMKAAEQELADIDRAIAALTLAPVEAGIPDALGEVDTRPMGKWTPVLEFMSRPGAVKWEIGKSLEPPPGVPLEVLFDNGAVELGTKETFNDEYDEAKGFIRAYRIISEPAAGEGEATEPAPEVSDYFPTQPFTIGASKPHADESDAQMFAAGINRELEKA